MPDLQASLKDKEKLIYRTLIFCAGIILYILWHGVDNQLYESLAGDAATLAGAIIMAFIGGGTWRDISIARINKRVNDDDTVGSGGKITNG